jgi:hypothetical protein
MFISSFHQTENQNNSHYAKRICKTPLLPNADIKLVFLQFQFQSLTKVVGLKFTLGLWMDYHEYLHNVK